MTKNTVNENKIIDADDDRIPILPMQLRKSIDAGGSNEIIFENGERVRIPLRTIYMFFDIYSKLKPIDREEMQAQAARSSLGFSNALITYMSKEKMPRSIY
jgi:hypothetical protein